MPSPCCTPAPCPGTSLLCCCPHRSFLATARTPEEGKGQSQAWRAGALWLWQQPTPCPAVRSGTGLPLGYDAAPQPGSALRAPQQRSQQLT